MSDDGPTPPMMPRHQRQLDALLPACASWQRKLTDAIRARETGWHRIHVRLEDGAVREVQTTSHTVSPGGAPADDQEDEGP